MNSEPIKFTEVKDKRLLKATPTMDTPTMVRLLFSVLVSGVNCDVHYLILKTNCLASRIKITISARLHLFCFSCPSLSVSECVEIA